MKFFDLLVIEKGRIDVSEYFQPGDGLVFLFDEEEHCFVAELQLENLSVEPEWGLVGQMSRVAIDGTVEIPGWVLQATRTRIFEDILDEIAEGFLAAPLYSRVAEKIVSVYLLPVDGLDERISQKKKKKDNTSPEISEFKKPREEVDLGDLSKDMLRAAFGPEFDTEIGRPKVAR